MYFAEFSFSEQIIPFGLFLCCMDIYCVFYREGWYCSVSSSGIIDFFVGGGGMCHRNKKSEPFFYDLEVDWDLLHMIQLFKKLQLREDE